ncbi:MAG: hypothetical protein JSU88_12185 [Nitrospinaceae bacterium]|jgi:hypothetical protein|nr:MAG: hypothetical protein JSU88_12185 [Nitrospinaceae bacterium]
MDITWLINSPELMVSLGLALLGTLLLLVIAINLAFCKKAVLSCQRELDQQTSLLKSQTEYLEGLDMGMQYFSDHFIKRMKIPPSGGKSAPREKITKGEEEAPIIEEV